MTRGTAGTARTIRSLSESERTVLPEPNRTTTLVMGGLAGFAAVSVAAV